ncbi:hypothetical protein E4T56_gene13297 [Termitomyces sp. T112]|nr:hypothetical protein E4T56_gene13297 [Termitomyces sp. T112]KNZ71478.1 hypothetical protein J132_09804 [Termitomyces sp. J132]
MQCYLTLLILAIVTAVSAHFQLQFPPPRGVFEMNDEITFCDGYMTPAATRSTFPLSNGFFSLNSEHPQFTTGVFVSTAGNPTSFNNFTQVKPFFQTEGEGIFCFPLSLSSSSNATSLQNGQNVTIQIVYDGGDGQLFQCADLTLSNDFTIPSDVPCTNATGSASGSSTSSTVPASIETSAANGNRMSAGTVELLLGALGANFFVL